MSHSSARFRQRQATLRRQALSSRSPDPCGLDYALSFVSSDIEKQIWLQEEARLREMIKKQLYEKDLHMQRQVNLEQRISQLLQEKASLSSEESVLQERVRHMEKKKALLVEKENSCKEMISVLSNENMRLRKQVYITLLDIVLLFVMLVSENSKQAS
ncbi:hypothetical protein Cgig2_022207 [Carnegiea gigantea]|uniref:Uncharacterized protein n=1 Tax=Carnegiea gigantea TaxID=171969 RepID=A0A9Q1QFA3_9CARY|nr:hypothetical protein Cgig2_022207 [Carnegiea gigantea]